MAQLICALDVIGVPAPQGSKTAFAAKGSGRAMTKESNPLGHAAWRNAVAEAAVRAALLPHDEMPVPFDGALLLAVDFRFPMPASRKKADRARGWCHKVSAPDTSKLVRCVEDALQAAGLIVDDARFVALNAKKFEVWQQWTGASIRIYTEDT